MKAARKLAVAACGIAGLWSAVPLLAQSPDSFADPRDKAIPEPVTAKLEVDWSGRSWWWALGECAAWHRGLRGKNLLHEDKSEPDERMMDFINPMLERLTKDRAIPMDQAMTYSRDAMDRSMMKRVDTLSSFGLGDIWDPACDGLLAAYKKAKI